MGIKFQAIHLPVAAGLLGGSSFAVLQRLMGYPFSNLNVYLNFRSIFRRCRAKK